VTPNGTPIDGRGLQPDRACGAFVGAEPSRAALPSPAAAVGGTLPPEAADTLRRELRTDGCMLTAERLLHSAAGAGSGGNKLVAARPPHAA
jgi:hypothetical protein